MPVTWYGERGVVNAIATFLMENEADHVTRVKNFLGCVQWSNNEPAEWIKGIETVEAIVEVGLADFGSPDLTFIVNRNGHDPRLIFLEAKVVPYEASALPNNQGMTHDANGARRYNSAINGQLALKYRFAQALMNREGHAGRVVEPEGLWHAYCAPPAQGGLADNATRPRRLLKHGVTELFAGFWEMKNCHYVALTWDAAPFFGAGGAGDMSPLLLVENENGEWLRTLDNVGWLGYGALTVDPAPPGGPHLMAALNTMIAAPEPVPHAAPADHEDGGDGAADGGLMAQIIQCATTRFGPSALRTNHGEQTTSVTVSGKVRAKVGYVPNDPHVKLGVAFTEFPEQWVEQPFDGQLPWRGSFVQIILPDGAEAALAAIDSIFEKLEERYPE